jgi:NTP pyrophosphatase (non-canonical NTP hydrolase)
LPRPCRSWQAAVVDLRDLNDRVEAISAAYARRNGIDRDADWYLPKLHEEVGELTQAFLAHTGRARDRGHSPAEVDRMSMELADVVCHAVLTARRLGVDLDEAIRVKWLARSPR